MQRKDEGRLAAAAALQGKNISIYICLSYSFWPTVLTVALLLQCCVCRLSVCDVMYCG